MSPRQKIIETLLRKEVASKCVASSVAFCFFGILIYFYGFRTREYFPVIRIMCIFIVASSFLRIYFSKRIVRDYEPQASWTALKITIWVNAMAWSTIFLLTTYELKAQGSNFAVMLAIMTGFLSASILTLAYDKTLFFPYNLVTLLPQIALFTYAGMIHSNEYGYMLAMTYSIYLAYQYKQYQDYRKQVITSFNYQLDLEHSLKELKESKEGLFNQTAKLMHTSRIAALGEMAAGLAHEINNPLMIIQGSSEQIERSLRENKTDSEMILNRIIKAKSSIFKIKEIIEGLQFFAQEIKTPHEEEVELGVVVNKTLHICSEMLKAHEVKLQVSEHLPAIVAGNPIQLSQVIYNLIKNADDAVIKLDDADERWISINLELGYQSVKLKITNGGPKILPDYTKKLLQPFFTTKDIGKGIGLSLSISRGITLEHRGDLYLEPHTDNTTFTLELPLKQ